MGYGRTMKIPKINSSFPNHIAVPCPLPDQNFGSSLLSWEKRGCLPQTSFSWIISKPDSALSILNMYMSRLLSQRVSMSRSLLPLLAFLASSLPPTPCNTNRLLSFHALRSQRLSCKTSYSFEFDIRYTEEPLCYEHTSPAQFSNCNSFICGPMQSQSYAAKVVWGFVRRPGARNTQILRSSKLCFERL